MTFLNLNNKKSSEYLLFFKKNSIQFYFLLKAISPKNTLKFFKAKPLYDFYKIFDLLKNIQATS